MKKKDVFWGLLLIFAAVLIVINQFGFFAGISMFEIVATVILVGIIINSVIKFEFWGILFPLAGICIIYAKEWNITNFTPWPALLTALLCSIGLSLIFKRPGVWFCYPHFDHEFSSNVVNEQDDNIINCSISFGETMKYVNTDNFERANVRCSFGEMKVYFDNALIPSGNADIYLEVSFGETILFIPKTWKIINDVHVFLGDMKEANSNIIGDSPVVTIHGNVSFGDCKIIYI